MSVQRLHNNISEIVEKKQSEGRYTFTLNELLDSFKVSNLAFAQKNSILRIRKQPSRYKWRFFYGLDYLPSNILLIFSQNCLTNVYFILK